MRKWAVSTVLLVGPASYAEPTRNIELTVFDPTPNTAGSTFQLQNAGVGKDGELAISTWVSYAANPLVLRTTQNDDAVVEHRTMLLVGGAYAFGGRFEAGARMPIYNQSGLAFIPPSPGVDVFSVPPASGTALGDVAVHGKALLWGDERMSAGLGLTVKLPTATEGEFAGTDMPSARALGLLTYLPSWSTAIHANVGAIVRKKAEFANIVQGSGIAWGLGYSQRLTHSIFVAGEVFGDVIPNGQFDQMGNYSTQMTIEGLAGARFHASQQMSLGLAAGRGLTAGIGSPDVRVVFTFAYTPSAPPLPAMRVAPPPPPVDLAKLDSDYDRFNDAVDKCPQQREDKDGFQDDDGCPELDNDNDKVADEKDKCIDQPEDLDKFEDQDGCPELDNDKDGVADAADKCPVEAERINGNDDDDGCADKGESLVISNPDRLELMESVLFTGTAVDKDSVNVLGQLAATLKARADILRIRITVHVQPSKSKDKDQALSDKRAGAVRDWLVGRGIDDGRIEAKGFGSSKPLVDPGKKGAAAINDRVELIILERKY